MSATAKVFTTGNSQAIRLPKAFRVEAREMWISKNAGTGEITLRPKPEPDALQALMDAQDKRRPVIELLLQQLPLLAWTSKAADECGQLKAHLKLAGAPIGDLDTQIAAHALVEKLVLVTHNTKHFENVLGLQLEDWF